MRIVLLTFLPLLVSNWAMMVDEEIETYLPDKFQMDLDFEVLSRSDDIQNLRSSGALKSDEMK